MKRFTTVALLFALAALLAVPMMAQEDEDVALRWRTRPDNQAEADVYANISDTIDEAWDGVALEYEPGGTETEGYQDVLVTEIEAGTAPDVFWIPGADIARFAEAGLILNVADLAAEDDEFSTDLFYPQPMQFLTQSLEEGTDTLWGVPRDVSSFALYYNQDLFDEAALPYPGGEDWDWDAFLEASEAISDLDEEVVGFGMNSWWANPGYFFNAAGASFFNDDYNACGLGNEQTVEALTFMQELYNNDYAVTWGDDAEAPFLAGNVGMFMNGRWATPGTVENADFNWNVATLPVGPSGEPTNWVFWGAYVVNANTEHPEEAFDLLTRLTSTEIQGQIAELGANIPSRDNDDARELFLNTTFEQDGEEVDVNNQAFLTGVQVGAPEAPLFAGDWPPIRDAYVTGTADVINGEQTAQEFADTICQQVAPYFEDGESSDE